MHFFDLLNTENLDLILFALKVLPFLTLIWRFGGSDLDRRFVCVEAVLDWTWVDGARIWAALTDERTFSAW